MIAQVRAAIRGHRKGFCELALRHESEIERSAHKFVLGVLPVEVVEGSFCRGPFPQIEQCVDAAKEVLIGPLGVEGREPGSEGRLPLELPPRGRAEAREGQLVHQGNLLRRDHLPPFDRREDALPLVVEPVPDGSVVGHPRSPQVGLREFEKPLEATFRGPLVDVRHQRNEIDLRR